MHLSQIVDGPDSRATESVGMCSQKLMRGFYASTFGRFTQMCSRKLGDTVRMRMCFTERRRVAYNADNVRYVNLPSLDGHTDRIGSRWSSSHHGSIVLGDHALEGESGGE
jgi:hypothetical protein